jgi:hypothetical protein
MRAVLYTAGERVELSCEVRWIADVLIEGAAGQLTADDGTAPDVRVTVERDSAAFDVAGWRVLTRGAWCRKGQVIVRDACSSGLDLRVTVSEASLDVVARWRPSGQGRAAVPGTVAEPAAGPGSAARLGMRSWFRWSDGASGRTWRRGQVNARPGGTAQRGHFHLRQPMRERRTVRVGCSRTTEATR